MVSRRLRPFVTFAATNLGVSLCPTAARAQRIASAAQYRSAADDLRREVSLPPIPRAGLDFSAVDAFWHVADLLAADKESSEAEWRELLSTTGYRLVLRLIPSTRADLEIPLRPSQRATFDSLAKLTGSELSNRVQHLARAYARSRAAAGISRLGREGIAHRARDDARRKISKAYNAAYARTPAVIRAIDSALVVAADDSRKRQDAGARVMQLLPSNGHFNGSYVAREIYETFGVDSLFPGVANPFAFWRAYGEAELARGNPSPFSPKAVALLDALERRYRLDKGGAVPF